MTPRRRPGPSHSKVRPPREGTNRTRLPIESPHVWWKRRDASLAAARDALGPGACEAHAEAGRRMDVEAALRAARVELRSG
ncbi:MAG TPA: hypothetical protein VLT84_07755 [Acidobacteriota bacterium]|nr:hypothetical protein [Acidobacteriota bacterium]